MKRKDLFFNRLWLVLLALPIVFTACNNDDDGDPDPVPTQTCLLTQENITYTESGGTPSTQKSVYKYNANNKLVKIEYTIGTETSYSRYDTLIYSGSVLDSIKSLLVVAPTTPVMTKKFKWTGSRLDSIIETGDNDAGDFRRKNAFTYNGSGVLTSMLTTYIIGSPDTDEIEGISNIVVTNGNITSGTLEGGGMLDGQSVTVAYDVTAKNPYYGLYSDTEDPLAAFSLNNPTSVTAGTAPLTVNILTRTYTYSNGRVATSNETDAEGGTTAKTYSFTCQ